MIWQSLLISFKVPLASFLHHDNFNSLAYLALFKYQELRTNAIAKPLELNELESGIKKSVAAVKVLMNQRSLGYFFLFFSFPRHCFTKYNSCLTENFSQCGTMFYKLRKILKYFQAYRRCTCLYVLPSLGMMIMKTKISELFCTLLFQLNFALFEKVYLSKFIGKTEGLFFGRVDHARRVEVCLGGGEEEGVILAIHRVLSGAYSCNQ